MFYGNIPIIKIYYKENIVWEKDQIIKSCFANGYWIDEYPWTDNTPWTNQ